MDEHTYILHALKNHYFQLLLQPFEKLRFIVFETYEVIFILV